MALSGSVRTSTYGSMGLVFSWSATQNVSKNQSTISWNVKSFGQASNFWYMAGNFKVVIDGSTVYSSSDRIKLYGNGATTVATGSRTLTHNNDGTRSFSVSLQAGIYYVAVNVSGSGSFTLDKIARTPSAPTSCTLTGDNGKMVLGEAVTVKWSGASGVITGYESRWRYDNGSWSASTNRSGTSFSETWNDGTKWMAGKTIQYAIRAMNGSLASAWCFSNTLVVSGAMDIKISNAWKTGSVWIKINGSWKRAKRVWIKINGSWKQSK